MSACRARVVGGGRARAASYNPGAWDRPTNTPLTSHTPIPSGTRTVPAEKDGQNQNSPLPLGTCRPLRVHGSAIHSHDYPIHYSVMSARSGGREALLPTVRDDVPASKRKPRGRFLPLSRGRGRLSLQRASLSLRRTPPTRLLFFVILIFLLLLNIPNLNVLRRDLGYVLRPLWDRPERPFDPIIHYASPTSNVTAWCALHSWTARAERPVVIDAVPISTELDMFEIRMREYAPFVSTFVVVEADATFSGAPKPLHFARNRERMDAVAKELGIEIVYHRVSGFRKLPKGSFENELAQRAAITGVLNELVDEGKIPTGSLIIQSDVDEIISRDTLDLLTTCQGFPQQLHLNMRNHLYSFDQPLRDEGYWRPRVYTTTANEPITYSHGRHGNALLMDAGWHCSFCFPTLEDMRSKMAGYAHNDRLTSKRLLKEGPLRRRVCRGEDPFGMWPEAFTFRDLVARSGGIRREHSFTNVPHALKEFPDRWKYLLRSGCERPNGA